MHWCTAVCRLQPGEARYLVMLTNTYQVIIRPDTEELPEVAEGNRCVGLKAEILEVVGGGEVASFAAEDAGESCEGRWLFWVPLPICPIHNPTDNLGLLLTVDILTGFRIHPTIPPPFPECTWRSEVNALPPCVTMKSLLPLH